MKEIKTLKDLYIIAKAEKWDINTTINRKRCIGEDMFGFKTYFCDGYFYHFKSYEPFNN